jgi:hypothetical protein
MVRWEGPPRETCVLARATPESECTIQRRSRDQSHFEEQAMPQEERGEHFSILPSLLFPRCPHGPPGPTLQQILTHVPPDFASLP